MPPRPRPTVDHIRYRGNTYRVGQAVLVNPAEDERGQAYIAQIRAIEDVRPRGHNRPARTASGSDGGSDEPGGAGKHTADHHEDGAAAAAAAGPIDDAAAAAAAAGPDPPENTRVRVRWYYRPEESSGGRRPFHAVRELLMSDHDDEVPLGSLIRRARVLPLAEFARAVPQAIRKLDPTPGARGGRNPGSGGGAGGAEFVEEDVPTYFARISYRPVTKTFVPEALPVFCTCESAYCPDDAAMICCPVCHEFYHPQCVGVSSAAADRIRRDIGLPSDPADVGAPPPPPPHPNAPVPWLCPLCSGERSRIARAR